MVNVPDTISPGLCLYWFINIVIREAISIIGKPSTSFIKFRNKALFMPGFWAYALVTFIPTINFPIVRPVNASKSTKYNINVII